MDNLSASIAAKKHQLDQLRPVAGDALRSLQQHFDVDLTYTSNALRGNTLTLRETAELIKHGLAADAKPIADHLEALDCPRRLNFEPPCRLNFEPGAEADF